MCQRGEISIADNFPGVRLIRSYVHTTGVYVFVISFASVYYLINAPLLLDHWDLGWHLAAGDLIRAQGSVPFQDPWSFTSGGRQWFNPSWLWDVFASALFEYANFIGLVLFVVACGAVVAGYLASVCLGSGASPIAVCISVLSACLLYPAFAAAYPNIYLAAAPNISTIVFSVVFYGECLKRKRGRFLLPAIMVLWANLHGGFLLGLLIVGIFCSAAPLKRDWVNFRIYGLIGVACFPEQRDELEQILDEASRRAPGYDKEDNQVRFQRYIDEAFNHGNPITIATAFHMASEHGWPAWSPPLAPTKPASLAWSPGELRVSFSNIPHRRWLYGTYLIRGEITVLAAPGGAGKTTLAIGIAAEIAAGSEKLDEKLWIEKDQKVLYLSGEEGGAEIMRRIYAFCQQHNISEQDIARLSVAAAGDARVQSMSLLQANERATVLNEEGFNCLRAVLETLRPDLLVFDPLVVFCGSGDMNGTTMALVMWRLKSLAIEFDCAILLVHHTRKGRANNDEPAAEAERISGSAAIVNLARRALMPVTMTEPETKAYPSVLPSERFRYFRLADVKSNLALCRWERLGMNSSVLNYLMRNRPPIRMEIGYKRSSGLTWLVRNAHPRSVQNG